LVDLLRGTILVLTFLATTPYAEAVDALESPYFVLVPYAPGMTATQRELPRVRGYKGERVATRYSFAFSGVELLIRIPKNSLTPSLEIVSPIPLSVMASSCLNVVQQSDSLIRIEIGRSCVSDDAGAGYVVLRDGLVEKRIDLSMVRVGTVTDQNSL